MAYDESLRSCSIFCVSSFVSFITTIIRCFLILVQYKTHVDLGLNFPPPKLCEAKALSFFTSEQAIEKLKKRFPKFKDKVAVLINISPSHGVGLLEGEHLNLWEFQDVNFLDAQEGGLENE